MQFTDKEMKEIMKGAKQLEKHEWRKCRRCIYFFHDSRTCGYSYDWHCNRKKMSLWDYLKIRFYLFIGMECIE